MLWRPPEFSLTTPLICVRLGFKEGETMAGGSTGTKIFMFALLIGVIGGILLLWQVRAGQMAGDFAQSVRAGEVEGFPMELRDKQWSER